MTVVLLVIFVGIGLELQPSDPPAKRLTDANFTRLRELILPRPEESLWETIPWRSTLWEAVQEAQDKDRPVLMWAMNGHPLGCT